MKSISVGADQPASTLRLDWVKYLSWSLAARLFPFFALPFAATRIDAGTFADFVLFLAIGQFLALVFLLGSHLEIMRVYYSAREAVSRLARATIGLSLIIFVPAAFTAALLGGVWIWSVIFGLGSCWITVAQTQLRLEERVHRFGLIDLIRVGLPYALLALAAAWMDFGLVWTSALASVAVGYLSLRSTYGKQTLARKTTQDSNLGIELRRLAYLGVAVAPHHITTAALPVVDRFLVLDAFGEADFTEYAVGVLYGQAGLMLADAYGKVWSPYCMRLLGEGRIAPASVLRRYLIVAPAAAPIFGLCVFFIATALLPDHYTVAPYVAGIAAAVHINHTAFSTAMPFVIHADRSRLLGPISIVASGFALLSMFFLVKQGALYLVPLSYLVLYGLQSIGCILTWRRRSPR